MARKPSDYRRSLSGATESREESPLNTSLENEIQERHKWFNVYREVLNGQRLRHGRESNAPPTLEEKRIWYRLLRRLFARCFEPGEFVRIQFETTGDDPPILMTSPQRLLSTSCLKKYERYLEDPNTFWRVKRRLDAENQRAERDIRINSRFARETVQSATLTLVTSRCPEVSFLVQYCIAHSAWKQWISHRRRFWAALDELRLSATVQYIFHRAIYDRLMGDLIPDELRNRAGDLYARYVDCLFR